MRLGFISDVHANIHALRAAWSALMERDVDRVICLGDLVGYGATPGEVIAFLRERQVPVMLGSSDARVAFELGGGRSLRAGVSEETLAWTQGILASDDVSYLRTLKLRDRVDTVAGRVRYFHGLPDDPDGRLDLQGPAPDLDAMLARLHCRVVVAGSTHVPYLRRTQQGIFVNPGSVGLSLNGEPGADCAVLNVSPADGVSVELLKVPYDFHAAAFDILTWGLPAVIATVIKTGRMQA
ncbi:MAG TPA: metallophosphoesterase family protein [Deinococcales bacterium]|nr:metallophosphoesterase family protein [Deinococcales bacterium]